MTTPYGNRNRTRACLPKRQRRKVHSLFGENVEKKISRAGTRRTAPGGSQGIVNKGLLTYRRWRDWISGRRRALHHLKKDNPSLGRSFPGRRFFYFPPLFSDGLRPFHIFLKYLSAHRFFSAFLPLFVSRFAGIDNRATILPLHPR